MPKSPALETSQGETPPSGQRWWQTGMTAWVGGRAVRVEQLLGVGAAIVRDPMTNHLERIDLEHLRSHAADTAVTVGTQTHNPERSSQHWSTASERLAAIEPLLLVGKGRSHAVKIRAEEIGVHPVTLHRWLLRYTGSNDLAELLPKGERSDKGASRLSNAVRAVVKSEIERVYLGERRSVKATLAAIREACERDGLLPPHLSTVRREIARLPLEVIAKREGRAALLAITPIGDVPQDAPYPLSKVQMDHVLLNIEAVDATHRLPIGQPWATFAIDVNSRMILGFSLSFESPSALSVGDCLVHALLPKEAQLEQLEIRGRWPCWGLMRLLHTDNAREFKGKMLERGALKHGIVLKRRPPMRPHYGGHVERLARTLKTMIADLRGSVPKARSERIRELRNAAVFTLDELEVVLVTLIVEVYHNAIHSALGRSPLQHFEAALAGTPGNPGRGVPARPSPEQAARWRMDFMPFVERTIQRDGVTVEGLTYSSDLLHRFIGLKDARGSRSQVFRRNPRDIRRLYFLDANTDEYLAIPTRAEYNTPIGLWEYRAERRRRTALGADANEQAVTDGLKRTRELEESAARSTRRARRNAQRRLQGQRTPSDALIPQPTQPNEPPEQVNRERPRVEPSLETASVWSSVVAPLAEIIVARPRNR